MAAKKSNSTLFIVVGAVLGVLLLMVFLMSQDWKHGRNRIADSIQAQFADTQGQFEYAIRLETFDGPSARDDAFVWYEKAAKAGHMGAIMAVADRLALRKGETNGDAAIGWYEKAANAGNAEAMRKLGDAHQNGVGTRKADPAVARGYYEKAAKAGDVRAKSLFGQILLKENKPKEAEPWLVQAAEAGDVEAYKGLGNLYYDITSPLKDFKKAAFYYNKAANAGVSEIMYNYGFMLLNGMGTQEDPVEAYKWFLIANKVRSAQMYFALDYMRKNLKVEQLKEGEQRAEAWHKAHPNILK